MQMIIGPHILGRSDYIKLVTLQTCWMHLQLVLVVFWGENYVCIHQ